MFSEKRKKILKSIIKGKILFDEPMKNHTSFRIGGSSEALYIPYDENDLKNLLCFTNKNNIPWTVIGNGTKLLFSDEGFKGIVIKISSCFNNINILEEEVTVGAGCSLSKLSKIVSECGLSGLEFAVGIPGTVGGAVVMNATAHGGMISDVLTSVTVMNIKDKVRRYSKHDLGFVFKQSKLQCMNSIVLRVKMRLKKNDVNNIKIKMHENIEWRKKNQPLDLPNAGCIFKNPKIAPAGKLIEMAGLKGLKVGDAKISEKHANFIVNLGNATACDIQNLINIIHREIYRKYSINLKPDILMIKRLG